MSGTKVSSKAKVFIDTNVVLYLLSEDKRKADIAEDLVNKGCLISVQVLNEMANVAYRRLSMSPSEIQELSGLLQSLCTVVPLTVETHSLGLELMQRYQLSLYDSMITAAAYLTDCAVLYSEDMHNGLEVYKKLVIRNPFAE